MNNTFLKSLRSIAITSGMSVLSCAIWLFASFLDNYTLYAWCMRASICLLIIQIIRTLIESKFSFFKEGDERDISMMYETYYNIGINFSIITGSIGIILVILSRRISLEISLNQIGIVLMLIYDLYFFVTRLFFYLKLKKEETL